MKTLAMIAPLVASAMLASCTKGEALQRYRVTVQVQSDRAPLLGARVSVGTRLLAQTAADGTALLDLPGHDGSQVSLTVRCPDGTRSPSAAVPVTLRTIEHADREAASRGIVQVVQCPPTDRTVAVIVRTEGQSNLPIRWRGEVVGRTDEGGVAHMTFRARPQTQLRLEVGAEGRGLLPANRSYTIDVADADDVVFLDSAFQRDPSRPPRPQVRPTSHTGRGTIEYIRSGSGSGGGSRTIRPRTFRRSV